MGLVAGLHDSAFAQAAAEAPSANLISHANDEEVVVYENLWDGVDSNNDLRFRTESLPVLPEGGGTSLRATPFPCSPNFADMNNDSLNDLVVCDAMGFIWIFLNSGQPGAPAFTTGTFLHTFAGYGSKLHVTDWDGDNDFDFLIGTFFGDVVLFENTGNNLQHKFEKKMGVPRYVDPRFTAPTSHRLPQLELGRNKITLGNYMAPWVADWNDDGKPDLLLGEGTYSANSVRLLVNAGTRNNPRFIEDKVYFLAYGEGHEHLTPAVTDYNGDGIDDMIMGTRKGDFRLHKGMEDKKNTQSAISAYLRNTPPPAILELDKQIRIPGIDSLSVGFPCDWNQDGLVDLLAGGTDGRVRIALNSGMKESPAYTGADPVKGTDVEKDRKRVQHWIVPDGFSVWYKLGPWNGSAYSELRAQNMSNCAHLLTSEESIQGTDGRVLKPAEGNRFVSFRYVDNYTGWIGGSTEGARMVILDKAFTLTTGESYSFSFSRYGGRGGTRWKILGIEQVKEGDEESPPQFELISQVKSFGAAPAWRNQEWTFRFSGENKGQDIKCYLFIVLPPGECSLALDHFNLQRL
jgi:hypothetical protein